MNWTIETAHSIATFKVRRLGISNGRGTVQRATDAQGVPTSVRASLPVVLKTELSAPAADPFSGAQKMGAEAEVTLEIQVAPA